MDSIRRYEELSFKQQLESLDKLREENTSGLFEVIEMKNKRLTYQEARIETLEREVGKLLAKVEKLNIEKLNLEYQLKQAEDAINK
jgi:hypothetical protein